MATVIDTLVTILDFRTNTKGIKKAESGLKSLEVETKALNVALLNLQHLFSGIISIFAIEKLVELNNEFDLVINRLQSVGLAGNQLNDVFSKLLDISNKTGTSIESNSELYQQMSVALGNAATEADKLTVVDTINKLFAINGTNTRTAKAAMQDLTKAISGATVNYQELRFAMKDVPALQALIVNHFKAIGVDWAEAVKGNKLATSEFIKILKDSNSELTRQFGLMSRTIPMAFMAIRNSFAFFVGEVGKASSGVSIFTTMMDKLAAVFKEWGNAVKKHTKEARAYLEAFAVFLGIISTMLAVRLAKMLLPFTRLAAGIMVVVLAIQDLWVFLRKGDSAFGNFLKWLGLSADQIDTVRNSILSFISMIKSLIKWLATSKTILIGFSSVLALIGTLWTVEKILTFIKALRSLMFIEGLTLLFEEFQLAIMAFNESAIVTTASVWLFETAMKAFILVTDGAKAAMIALNFVMKKNLIALVITSIISLITALYSFSDTVRKIVNNVFSFLNNSFLNIGKSLGNIWNNIINSLISAWDGFINKITSGFKVVKDTVNKALNLVGLGEKEEQKPSSFKQFQGNVVDFGANKLNKQKQIQTLIQGAQSANSQLIDGFRGNVITPQQLGQFNQNNQNTVNVTVNATTNADPDQIASMTSRKVQESLGQHFRSAAINADNSIAR